MADNSDDNLQRLDAVVNEIEAHYGRLVREAKLGRATVASIMQELSETVMPLMKDFSVRMFAEMIAVRQYIHQEVEPALQRIGDDQDSLLLADDAEMITQRLLSYRSMLEAGITRLTGEDKTRMEAELTEVDTTLARVAEITEEVDPDDDNPEAGDEPEVVDDDEGDELEDGQAAGQA
jgi:hypothetical protein